MLEQVLLLQLLQGGKVQNPVLVRFRYKIDQPSQAIYSPYVSHWVGYKGVAGATDLISLSPVLFIYRFQGLYLLQQLDSQALLENKCTTFNYNYSAILRPSSYPAPHMSLTPWQMASRSAARDVLIHFFWSMHSRADRKDEKRRFQSLLDVYAIGYLSSV